MLERSLDVKSFRSRFPGWGVTNEPKPRQHAAWLRHPGVAEIRVFLRV